MHQPAQQHAEGAGQQPRDAEGQAVRTRHRALRQSQHAQQRAIVEVAQRVEPGRHRDCDRAQQRREQRDQVQELLGPVQRLSHLGPSALERLDPDTAQPGLLEPGVDPLPVAPHGSIVAREREPVVDSAGRLHQCRRGQIGLVHQHAWREAQEAGATVGLLQQQACDAQAGVAEQQVLSRQQAERVEQAGLDPDRAGLGRLPQRPASLTGPVGEQQLPAQRIARRDRLERDQPGCAAQLVGRARHGREAQVLGRLQSQRLGLLPELDRQGLVAAHHQVAAEQRARIALQSALQPVGEEADRTQRRHRQRHGQQQQGQLAGAPVAPERAQSERPDRRSQLARHAPSLPQQDEARRARAMSASGHGASLTGAGRRHRPAAGRRSWRA